MSICLSGNREVRARKDRKCDHCNEWIRKCELYITRSGVEPGEGFWRYNVHPECDKATQHWKQWDWEDSAGVIYIRGTEHEK